MALETLDRKLDFSGSDIDKKAIRLAKSHAVSAGVAEFVNFETKSVSDFYSNKSRGVIITNPPYGERLLEKSEAEELYKVLGEKYRQLDNWSAFIITSDNEFERYFGKKADKNRKLYNSNKECKFYQYFYNRYLWENSQNSDFNKGEDK